jgi:choline dehydrogenase
MSDEFDFVIVGGGSAGAVIASRLSEDPSCKVALIEAGERQPAISSLPIAPAAMQLNPAADWMYTADPGKAGLGLNGRRIPVPRGKMLGGSSGINSMVYVRGHPGDFDSWAEGGAIGWSYDEVLPLFPQERGPRAQQRARRRRAGAQYHRPARGFRARPDTPGRAPIRRGGGRRRYPARRL